MKNLIAQDSRLDYEAGDLLIHPGETIADVLTERGITSAELAERTGVTETHIHNVIAGKSDISTEFASALEEALGVPKSFWMNLQANYDAEIKNTTYDASAVSVVQQ